LMCAPKSVDAIHCRDKRQRDNGPDARHRHQTTSAGSAVARRASCALTSSI
jgi:hypothetical protein